MSYRLTREGPFLVAEFSGHVPSSEVRDLHAALLTFARAREGQTVSLFAILRPGLTLSARGRQAILDALADRSLRLGAWVAVIQGEGFMAATARSIAGGILLAARTPYPVRVFSGVQEAAGWLDRTFGAAPPPSCLAELDRWRASAP